MSDQENKLSTDEQQAAGTQAEPATEAATAEDIHLLLEDARNKADEHWNQLLRVQAEMENLRKRAERDLENAHKYALERFAGELLPVKDGLELGLAAASDPAAAAEKLREGTELTLKMLKAALEKFGIKEVDPQGERFNPELHQAMAMQPSTEHAANTVLTVYQKGYTLNDRLIRPALVIVSSGAADAGGKVDQRA